jgi:hypothetical protein
MRTIAEQPRHIVVEAEDSKFGNRLVGRLTCSKVVNC